MDWVFSGIVRSRLKLDKMKTYIRRREANKRLIILFGTWGTDHNLFLPLCRDDHDFILYYNYSADEPLILPEKKSYEHITVIGWSLGVWAAEYMARSMNLKPDLSIAVNGTPFPADNRYGIPIPVFEGTLNRLDKRVIYKYHLRLFGTKKELEKHPEKISKRELKSFEDELRWLYNRIMESYEISFKWDIALTSANDRVFPYDNMHRYWESRDETKVVAMPLPHYPFFNWSSFGEMIDSLVKAPATVRSQK